MITKKDILEAIGAEFHEDKFVSGMLVGIGVGAIVGGAVALLLAPKTGPEIRELLSERGADLVEKAKTRIGLKQDGGRVGVEGATTTTPGIR